MVGEVAALCTALCWAIAARLFRILGASFSTLSLNFWKGIIATLILGSYIIIFPTNSNATHSDFYWLIFSGIVGIGLGDTFFFEAIKRVGDAESVLIAETIAPVFTALLAMLWIAEWLTWQQWLGIGIVLFAVDMVVKDKKRNNVESYQSSGYFFAGGAAVCQSIGAVISRDVLTTSNIGPAESATIRLIGGLIIVIGLIFIRKKRWLPITQNKGRTWALLLIASILGTLFAMYLQMLAFANAPAAIVQTLFATSVLLSLGVAYLLGEKATRNSIFWSCITLVGVTVLLGADYLNAIH